MNGEVGHGKEGFRCWVTGFCLDSGWYGALALLLGNSRVLRGRVEFEVYGGQVGLSSWLFGS